MTSILKINEDEKNTSENKLESLIKKERFLFTCTNQAQNKNYPLISDQMVNTKPHVEGFTASEIINLADWFYRSGEKIKIIHFNYLSRNQQIWELGTVANEEDQARALLLKGWLKKYEKEIYEEVSPLKWNLEYLDQHKSWAEIVDGKKHLKASDKTISFVLNQEKEATINQKEESICDLRKLKTLHKAVHNLIWKIKRGMECTGSNNQVEINVVQGNRYLNTKYSNSEFQNDLRKKIMICFCIGGEESVIKWQWFKNNSPVGEPIEITLNSGDVIILNQKATGFDWKDQHKYTLRKIQ